ncbi:DUF2189 domain-containing protein [Microvirga antarctica]|uniref:DUF2189 domain-containing protein n=1 Tax=Microvirga antarctica TaxID=2819233 RepID=UPI001B301A59|nr:DUF2189 domain-containing protein [Microvirga antarctica]
MAKLTTMPTAGLDLEIPHIRHIRTADLRDALRLGVDDFRAMPTHALFVAVIYPILGVLLAAMIFGNNILPLLFPIMAGFGLLGPVAAIGLYELSRLREQGGDIPLSAATQVVRSPAIGSIALLGLLLLAIFLVWLGVAQALYQSIFGSATPASLTAFVREVLTTPKGWTLIIVGNAIGFVFSMAVLALSVVSFPMLVDRHVGIATAIQTSIRAFATSPGTMIVWGLIVSAFLLIGFIPFFFGLAVTLPILGHATWHLYRRIVGP